MENNDRNKYLEFRKPLDNIHFSSREVNGYGKYFIAIISEREPGKSTDIAFLVLRAWCKGKPSVVLRRRTINITKQYIDDWFKIYRKFLKNPPIPYFSISNKDEGMVDVMVDGELFFRIISLSSPLYQLKGQVIPNIAYVIFDEFICNTRMGEKYLPDEAFRFKELYKTLRRETDFLKAYFLGNPYSLYNPIFAWWGVDTTKLRRGSIIAGKTWVVQCYEMKPELRAYLRKVDPLYTFDDDYTKYAFDGLAVNDVHVRLNETQPNNYYLKFLFKVDNHFIGVFENNNYEDLDNRFWCGYVSEISKRRTAYCFDFNELISQTCRLLSGAEKIKFSKFKEALRNRAVEFSTLVCYYLIEELFHNI